MKETKLIEIIKSAYAELSPLLPDQLYEKANQKYQFDLIEIQSVINGDIFSIKKLINQHRKWHFDTDDTYLWLRRILERQDEYKEENATIKRIFAHIRISEQVFFNLMTFVNKLLMDFSKSIQGSKSYYQQYVKIGNALEHLIQLGDEYHGYLQNIEEEVTGVKGVWEIRLPEPQKMLDLVSEIIINMKEGALSFPLLRSYIEVKLQIILENTLNQKLHEHNNSSDYKDQEIIFLRNMEFSDLLNLTDIFKIIRPEDKEILDRFHKRSSKAIHTGSFSDQIVAWYLLFYLYNLDISAGSSFGSLFHQIAELEQKRKLRVISQDDNHSKYLRFQSTSNLR